MHNGDQMRKTELLKKISKPLKTVLPAVALMFCLCACGGDSKIILTTGFMENELFRIDGLSCDKSEYMVYLTNIQDQYESAYGSSIWTAGNGEDFYFDWWQHCMVIYGYDKAEDTVYAADPLKGNVTYSLSQFNRMYDILGKQAVVICGDASTEGHHITTEAEKSITCLSYNEQKEKELVAVEDVTDEIYVYEEAPVPEEER